jgi:hypothetical protein
MSLSACWPLRLNFFRLTARPRPPGQERRVRHKGRLRQLTTRRILRWADDWHEAHWQWPAADSGEIPGAGGETWNGVNQALVAGGRGLTGGSSLYLLLRRRRGAWGRRSPLQPKPRLRGQALWRAADRLRGEGMPVLGIARTLGVGTEKVERLLQAPR